MGIGIENSVNGSEQGGHLFPLEAGFDGLWTDHEANQKDGFFLILLEVSISWNGVLIEPLLGERSHLVLEDFLPFITVALIEGRRLGELSHEVSLESSYQSLIQIITSKSKALSL